MSKESRWQSRSSNRQVEELHQRGDHQGLFFRDQQLDVEPTSGSVGISVIAYSPQHARPGRASEILPIHADANSRRIAGEYWALRCLLRQEPPMGSILYLHTVPDCGGDTLFASQLRGLRRAYPRA